MSGEDTRQEEVGNCRGRHQAGGTVPNVAIGLWGKVVGRGTDIPVYCSVSFLYLDTVVVGHCN